ncbi:MAG TPA: hypothetical protein VII96_08985 [Acidimicrobiales bacterium]
MLAAVILSACGSGSTASTTTTEAAASTTALVKPPDLTMQGCNYVVNGSVPAAASGGTQPPFTLSGPNAAGEAALRHIRDHGGTGLVNGYTLPPGVKLYAGPDAHATPVATIPDARSLLVADPVLWTTSSGALWLASFVACGGKGLYWIDVAQIGKVDSLVGNQVTTSIATLKAATPYPGSGTASALPVTITGKQQFAWANPAVTFAIGRGQYLGY